jgi:hypothetical protein
MAMILEDVKINIKILLAALWISHFLLWTFGDMLSLLQETTSPVSNELLLFVAVPLAIIQTLMILFTLIGKPKIIRWVNIIISLMFIVFNLSYLSDGNTGWEYLLALVYLLFNILIIWFAWKWPTQGTDTKNGK